MLTVVSVQMLLSVEKRFLVVAHANITIILYFCVITKYHFSDETKNIENHKNERNL